MRRSIAGWVLVGSLAGCALATSACELIVGGGDYKTAGGDGDGGAESGGTAGSGVGSSGGVAAGSGVSTSGVGGSGASSGVGGSGASSGVGGSGVSSGVGGSGASSGVGGSGASSGASGSGASSSGAGGSGASSGTGSSEASAFVGTWQTSSTQVFSNCTDASYDGSEPTTGAFTWTIGGTGLTGANASGCTFNATVSGKIALVPAGSKCTLANATSGETDRFTFQYYAWILSADGTTAQIDVSGTDTATFSNGTSSTCDVSLSGTATR